MAWRSLLGFRKEPWHWQPQRDLAHWWVVDGSQAVPPALTQALKEHRHVQGIMLARAFVEVADPVWVFFKTPVKSTLAQRWLDQRCQQLSAQAGSNTLHGEPVGGAGALYGTQYGGKQFHLHRWPNLTRYQGQTLALTSACIRMLSGWTCYTELRRICHDPHLLHTLLDDCTQLHILDIAVPTQAPAARPTLVHPLFQWIKRRFQ